MTESERKTELKTRIEELNAVAEWVPPHVLTRRLLSALEDFYEADVRTLRIAVRIDEIADAPPEFPPPPGEPIAWIPEPLSVEKRPEPAEVSDPGIPARAEDRAMLEIPAAAAEDLEEAPPEPEASEPEERAEGEIWKPCKSCGEPKPLSAFPKNPTYKDKHTNKCKECTNAPRRAGETSPKVSGASHTERRLKADATKKAEEEKIRNVTVLPPAVRVPEPEEIRGPARPKAPERFCANGEQCMAVKHTGRPTKLNSGNRDPICFGCQEAGIGEKPQEKMIVRHSAASQGDEA